MLEFLNKLDMAQALSLGFFIGSILYLLGYKGKNSNGTSILTILVAALLAFKDEKQGEILDKCEQMYVRFFD